MTDITVGIERMYSFVPHLENPAYAHEGDAGADLRADDYYEILPGNIVKIGIGVKLNIPPGVVGFINPRSGLASKGIGIANAPGTIDSGYRGEIKVLLENRSSSTFTVEPGDRIAQIVFVPFLTAVFDPEAWDDGTQRGSNGFGSSGVR